MSGLSPASLSEDDVAARKAPGQFVADAHRSCKVCGDRANGYNFGVLTCESCKAFFRRNAMKEEEIKCPFSNNCGITSASRRFCQACRLRKCFAVGMSRSWLNEQKPRATVRKRRPHDSEASNSDEEVSVPKAYLKELIRKSKRLPSFCECTCTCGFYPAGTRLTALNFEKECLPATYPTTSSYSAPSVPFPQLPSLRAERQPPLAAANGVRPLEIPVGVHNPQELINLQGYGIGPNVMLSAFSTVQPSYAPLQPITPSPGTTTFSPVFSSLHSPGPTSPSSSKMAPSVEGPVNLRKYAKLSLNDMNLLQELIKANEPLKAPLDLHFNDELTLMDVVKISEAALKRIVCMARDLAAFQELDIEDKKNIMKGSCSELLILRGVMAFDPNKNTWNHNFAEGIKGMEVKLDVLKSTKETQHYEEHKRFLTEFNEQIRTNECVMLLLMALVIFRPDRHNLRDKERVRAIQNTYYGVLRRVLECEYAANEALTVYEMLVRKLEELKHLKEGLVRIYYGFDSRQLDPLIKELFDMM
ncbi:hypothetical protein Y032_0020g197 [Ancylostoma ceylanicum]|uniref:Zinc finger, C4 type n=1 Tax=Ancylostoma ceylanicum TaxID=53326 RepID=A0A016V1E7_9BILA|nr:hypothetical protein Y032_0020g197 [Ancylostoma ceylanicum]